MPDWILPLNLLSEFNARELLTAAFRKQILKMDKVRAIYAPLHCYGTNETYNMKFHYCIMINTAIGELLQPQSAWLRAMIQNLSSALMLSHRPCSSWPWRMQVTSWTARLRTRRQWTQPWTLRSWWVWRGGYTWWSHGPTHAITWMAPMFNYAYYCIVSQSPHNPLQCIYQGSGQLFL